MNCDPCKTLNCETTGDFDVYSLQGRPDAQFPADDPTDTTPCSPCPLLACPEQFEDLTIYSLQTNIVFNTDPITVTVPCPDGWTCSEEVTITYPPGTFVLPDPDPENHLYIAQGCLSLISATTAAELFALLAAQQAYCDTVVNPPDTWEPPSGPPPPPAEHEWYNHAVSQTITCTAPEELVFTGTAPYWITVDEGTGVITGAAGTFVSTVSQADANSRASVALAEWIALMQSDDTLKCQAPYLNTPQSWSCADANGAGYFDQNQTDFPINEETGLYTVDGVVYAAAGYYESLVSQADANAQALAAAQAAYAIYVSGGYISCYTCGFTTENTPSNYGSWTWPLAGLCNAGIFSGWTIDTSGPVLQIDGTSPSGAGGVKVGSARMFVFNDGVDDVTLQLQITWDMNVDTSPVGYVSWSAYMRTWDTSAKLAYTGPLPQPEDSDSEQQFGSGSGNVNNAGSRTISVTIPQTGGTGGRKCRCVEVNVCAYMFGKSDISLTATPSFI